MTDPAGFLDAIREWPGDLVARRAYADWLEENGEPDLAELARLGVERRGLPDDDPRREALESRCRALRDGTLPRLDYAWADESFSISDEARLTAVGAGALRGAFGERVVGLAE